ncbi:MAG: Stk1 family PASTA domain-containing Ser/Thr kinase [Actinobacteria bacterium]|nr:Stk1 family PASTA domain-containing Ser/Thr kinase [Actinomycetota bacterium]
MGQQIFNDRYRVVAKIGAGGMADVYKAIDTVLGRPVAIKVLHRHFAEDEDFVSRFRREAQAAANLNHPNIVSIYDWGSQNGTYFIVMELLEGQSLKQRIQAEGVIPPAEAMEIAKKVLSALNFAHRHDIVHRDIKPHNIILAGEDEVKVTDFGIARAGTSTMTQTGTILGTAHYLSPEQARGQEVDTTSDIYSMGVVFYEMVTGKVPFDGENPVSIALKHVHEAPVRPTELNPEVPSALQAVILKAMAKDPGSRYQSASEMRSDIMRLMEGMPIATVPPDEQETLVVTPKRTTRVERAVYHEAPRRSEKNWPAILLVLFLLFGVSAAGGWFLYDLGILSPKLVTVPKVVGKSLEDAKLDLKSRNLKIGKVRRDYSKETPGHVISQEPKAGSELEEGKEVSVVISIGRKKVSVPDVVGEKSEDAVTKIVKANLEPKYRYEPSDEAQRGRVIYTEPGPGERLPEGSAVKLVIGKGPETLQVPDVQGKTRDEAKGILDNAGLQITLTEEPSENISKDTVTRTVPIAGSEVKKGSSITVYISSGPKMITVPNVVGMVEDEAKEKLADKGFSNIEVQDIPGVQSDMDGKVISQDPSKGKQERSNAKIQIFVGKAND